MWLEASSLCAEDSHHVAVKIHHTCVQNTISLERALVKTGLMDRPIFKSKLRILTATLCLSLAYGEDLL